MSSTIPSVELTPSQDRAETVEESNDDVPPPALIADSSLDLREAREVQAYNILRSRTVSHTRAIDTELLGRTSMDDEFHEIWHALG